MITLYLSLTCTFPGIYFFFIASLFYWSEECQGKGREGRRGGGIFHVLGEKPLGNTVNIDYIVKDVAVYSLVSSRGARAPLSLEQAEGKVLTFLRPTQK